MEGPGLIVRGHDHVHGLPLGGFVHQVVNHPVVHLARSLVGLIDGVGVPPELGELSLLLL